MRTVADIARDVATQDNLCTENPLFVVQQRRRIFGLAPDYVEDFVWLSADSERTQADQATTDRLEKFHELAYEDKCTLQDEDGPCTWERVGYRDMWVFVTGCFTRAGCEAYLRLNGHNLGETRIYVEGGYRNHEWETMRKHLLEMPGVLERMNAETALLRARLAKLEGSCSRCGENDRMLVVDGPDDSRVCLDCFVECACDFARAEFEVKLDELHVAARTVSNAYTEGTDAILGDTVRAMMALVPPPDAPDKGGAP
jgi:hypothetical protein